MIFRLRRTIAAILATLFLGITASLLTSCGVLGLDDDSPQGPKPGEVTVLFIGSSYLAFNDVPTRFRDLARKAGHPVFVKSHTYLGRPLGVHATDAGTAHVIQERPWDFVVVQGGAHDVAYPEGASHPVLPALRELHRKATEASPGTRVVWMMPWAYEDGMLWVQGRTEDYAQMQVDIREHVLDWADQVGLIIAPAGWAFYRVLTTWNPGVHFLHDRDWNHASEAGSFLTAATFFSTLFAESCTEVDYRWKIEKTLARDLREVASATVLQEEELWNIPGSGGG